MKRRLLMADKKFESLEAPKFTTARVFYTEAEMQQFRKPKKKSKDKTRKRKPLKATDLIPDGELKPAAAAEKHKANGDQVEEGEIVTATPREALKIAAAHDEEESDEDGMFTIVKYYLCVSRNIVRIADWTFRGDLGAVAIDDEAEDELQNALERARRLKQQDDAGDQSFSYQLISRRIKQEEQAFGEDEASKLAADKGIVIDATSEQYKMIGDIVTFGLAGNRDEDIDYSELIEEQKKIAAQHQKEKITTAKRGGGRDDVSEDDEMDVDEAASRSDAHTHKRSRGRRRRRSIDEAESNDDDDETNGDAANSAASSKPRWKTVGADEQPGPSSSSSSLRSRSRRNGGKHSGGGRTRSRHDTSGDEYGADYKNVLGEEREVTKGVGAMLRLAGERGYLPSARKDDGDGALKHLESKRALRVEQGRM